MFNVTRYKNRITKTFEIEVVTPMFLGGADCEHAEFRSASFKGALRFWWRALYGSDDLDKMRKQEADIFGSTNKKSNVKIMIKETNVSFSTKLPYNQNDQIYIFEYLAYGHKNKEYINPQSEFNLILSFNNMNGTEEIQILNSFAHFIIYGGIGSKSRNGFGSIHVMTDTKATKTDLCEQKPKDYTAISSEYKIFRFPYHDSWQDALFEIGKAYKDSRYQLKNIIRRELIAKPFKTDKHRHAKPYFLHVNKSPDGKYQGQILFLPYRYYENGSQKAYDDACKAMNQELKKLSGGAK